ncbi:hypothetical protein [Methyloglobulus sp.]
MVAASLLLAKYSGVVIISGMSLASRFRKSVAVIICFGRPEGLPLT